MPNDAIVSPMSTPTTKKSGKMVRQKPYAVAIGILAVLAAAGIGLGVTGLILNNGAKREVADLQAEVDQKNDAIKKIEEQLGAQVEIEEETDTGEVSEEVKVSAATDYIYVGEWGIKIKVPEDLTSVTYTFVGGKDRIYISGAKRGEQYYPTFLENSAERGSGMGVLHRYNKTDSSVDVQTDSETGAKGLTQKSDGYFLGSVVYENEDYYFCYSHAQGLSGTETERDWEITSADMVEDMLKHGVSAF